MFFLQAIKHDLFCHLLNKTCVNKVK